jgi:archaellum biogenesis protein FlaJ (TadC family)
MAAKGSYVYKALYFILVSVLLAAAFYFVFGAIFKYRHPFFNYSIFTLFLATFILLTIIIYLLSFKDNFRDETQKSTRRTRATVLIMVAALMLSAVFPATALVGVYPVTMAMFHLLILFFAGISVAALSLSGVITLWRNGAVFSALSKGVFTFSVLISLGISCMTLYLFRLLPLS